MLGYFIGVNNIITQINMPSLFDLTAERIKLGSEERGVLSDHVMHVKTCFVEYV